MGDVHGARIDRVPRTEQEEALLLRLRPDGWEYLLFGAVLRREMNKLEPKWQAHQSWRRGTTPPGPTDARLEDVPALMHQGSAAFAEAPRIVSKADELFSPESTERAFGKMGEAGDADRIRETATGIVSVYANLLDWSERLRATPTPERLRTLFDDLSDLVNLPLRQFRDFTETVVSQLDDLPAALREDRPISLKLVLTLSMEPDDLDRVQRELRSVADSYQLDVDQRVEALERAAAAVEAQAPRGRRSLFGRLSERRAQRQHAADLGAWEAERDACAERLELATTYQGETANAGIMLNSGEAVFATITGANLVEDRRGAGHWEGRSSGLSIPVGSIGGRSIRYRVGATRGHFVQGASLPTAIDTGTLYVTNQRAVFQGARQTRECRFDKLIGFQHTDDGATVFSVSNRQKPTVVHYGTDLAGWFAFRLDLALAHYRSQLPQLVESLKADLVAVDAAQPAP